MPRSNSIQKKGTLIIRNVRRLPAKPSAASAAALPPLQEGSRVKLTLNGAAWGAHRPHPGKEAKKYQVEQVPELFERIGVTP